MAFRPRAGDIVTPDTHARRDGACPCGDAEGESLPEWRRAARRVLLDFEYVREHCRRQREMLAAQREYLRALDGRHAFARFEGSAREAADDEDIRAGE